MRLVILALLVFSLASCATNMDVKGARENHVSDAEIQQIKQLLRDRPTGVPADSWAPVHRIIFEKPDRAYVELIAGSVCTQLRIRKSGGNWRVDVSSINVIPVVTS